MNIQKFHQLLLISFLSIFVWSAYKPVNYLTWFLESSPAIIALVLLVLTYRNYKLTPLLYSLIWVYAVILVIGGHYTYEKVPFGFWLERLYETGRNNYDKIGHFAQGVVPAIAAREILIRRKVVKSRAWLFFIIVCIVLAASAGYELVEFGASVTLGSAAEEFLGTQGYIWDTQTDMLTALIGAIFALVLLSTIHDRQLSALKQQKH